MPFKNVVGTLFLSAILSISFSVNRAEAGDYFQAGQLICYKAGPQINILLHSQFPITCNYKDGKGNTEAYKGRTGIAFGISLQKIDDAIISFNVLAGGNLKPGKHALSGFYVGGKIDISKGEGSGIDVLVGGGIRNLALQPAVQETLGTGIAAGIGFLVLQSDDSPKQDDSQKQDDPQKQADSQTQADAQKQDDSPKQQ